MPGVARIGDPCTHGATITTGSSTKFVNGKGVARVDDMVNCPTHGPNPIKTGSATVFVEGKAVAVVGSTTQCGAVITAGSTDTFS